MPSKLKGIGPRGAQPLSGFRETPLQQVRELYISFVQGLFAACPPGYYHWAPTLEETEIVITDENPINVSVIGKRPAISFARGPVQLTSLGLDDMLSYDMQTGKKQKSVLVPGVMSINCLSRNDQESENLAWWVAEGIWMHRERLLKSGFFEIGRHIQIGRPSAPGQIVSDDGASEWYVTVAQSPFQFYRTSSNTPLAESSTAAAILSEIAVDIHTQRIAASVQAPAVSYAVKESFPYQVVPDTSNISSARVPMPGNPAKDVTVQAHRPGSARLRPPSIRGRTIPIVTSTVEESETPTEDLSLRIKV